MTVTYAWIITRDYLYERLLPESQETELSEVSVAGPRNVSNELHKRVMAGEGQKFRMYDDDGDLYYEGRIILEGDDDLPSNTEWGLAPLEDFGGPNAGCTEIRYLLDLDWSSPYC